MERIDYISRVANAVQLGLLPAEALYSYSYNKVGLEWYGLLKFNFKNREYVFTSIGGAQGTAKARIAEQVCRAFRINQVSKKNAARNELFESGYKIKIQDLDWGKDGVTGTLQLYQDATDFVTFRKKMCAANLHAFGEAVKVAAWEYLTFDKENE